MSTLSEKKSVIFDRFSRNLGIITRELDFRVNPDKGDDLYICPLSFSVFTRDGLSDVNDDQLTLEHAPPRSLNGAGICLTEKTLNSKSGYTLDKVLDEYIKRRDYHSRLAPYTINGYVDGVKTPIEFSRVKEKPEIWIKPRSMHQGTMRILDSIKTGGTFNLKFSYGNDSRKLDLSLLRTAYLLAFSKFGYSLIFGMTYLVNPHYQRIRDQLMEMDKEGVSDIPYLNSMVPDSLIGVNLITKPYELRSILVVFGLKHGNHQWNHGVFLPCPDDYGFNALPLISKTLHNTGQLDFELYHFGELDITDPSDSLALYREWKKRNGVFKMALG